MEQAQRLSVPGRFEYLAQIAGFVTQAARSAGLSDDDVFHVEMAVDEACSNIIEHAYRRRGGEINLTCLTPKAGRLEIVIHDTGEAFDPEVIPPPALGNPANLENLKAGGLGLYFMRKLMDDVRFECVPGAGNTLYMSKQRKV